MSESELESVARRLRENGNDFSTLELKMNPSYEAGDVNFLTEAILANHTLKEVQFFGILSEEDVNQAVGRLVESFASLPNLQTLKVSGYCVDLMASLGRLLDRVPSLKSLTIQYVQLQGDLNAFNEALRRHTGLSSFHILDCQLQEPLRETSVLNEMMESLVDKPSLKEVVLSPINQNALGKIPVEGLCRLCRNSPNLERLHLSGFRVQDKAPQVTPLMQALQSSPSIEDLGLQAALTKENWVSMAQFVQRTNTLKRFRIDVDQRGIEDHILELAKALPLNSSLQELMIMLPGLFSYNPAREEFGNYLENNYSLRVCHPETATSAMWTRLNQQGRGELIQNDNASRMDWISKLVQAREDLDSVYYFLSMNPSLCEVE